MRYSDRQPCCMNHGRIIRSAEADEPMRPPGAPDQLEQRRRRAVQLLQAGRPTSAVARQVQASVSSVWRWWQTYQRAGPARPAAHADPRATAAVVRGPAAHAGEDPGTGAAPSGLPHRSLDPRAGGQGDPSAVQDSVSPQPCLEAADRPRLAMPAARTVRDGEADASAHAAAGAAPGWSPPWIAGPSDGWSSCSARSSGVDDPGRTRQALTANGWRCPRLSDV